MLDGPVCGGLRDVWWCEIDKVWIEGGMVMLSLVSVWFRLGAALARLGSAWLGVA